MTVTGMLETHLTIDAGVCLSEADLSALAASHGLKLTRIVLDRGQTALQPMLTRTATAAYKEERHFAAELAGRLGEAGCRVARIKIEAAPDADGVPVHEPPSDGACYFEHHVKVRARSPADLDRLSSIAAGQDARLSRNAIRVASGGGEERFVTQRCHDVGREAASLRLRALVEAVSSAGFELLESVQEFVLYDSNVDLDRGWLDGGGNR